MGEVRRKRIPTAKELERLSGTRKEKRARRGARRAARRSE